MGALAQRDITKESGPMFKAIAVSAACIALTGASALADNTLERTFLNRYGLTDHYDVVTYTWPDIGTDAYTGSCAITTFAEDGSARAFCTEDGATYVYDPDGFSFMDHGILFRVSEPGWTEVR